MIEQNLDVLHIPSMPVLENDSLGILFEQLERGLANSPRPGIGLAAIQLSNPKRAFIIALPGKPVIKVWNPEVIEWGTEQVISPEGCLSLPNGVNRSVTRYTEVTFKNGDGRTYTLDGMEAIVFQHELSHCNGKLIIDEPMRVDNKVGRNDPCPCNSGKKFKKCCLK